MNMEFIYNSSETFKQLRTENLSLSSEKQPGKKQKPQNNKEVRIWNKVGKKLQKHFE